MPAVESAAGKFGHRCLNEVSILQGSVPYGCQQGLWQSGSPAVSFRLCDDFPSASAVTELLGVVVTGRQVYESSPATIAAELPSASESTLRLLPECKPLVLGGQSCSDRTRVPNAQKNAQR